MWKFETPTLYAKRQLNKNLNTPVSTNANINNNINKNLLIDNNQKIFSLYKLNYTRWMCYNFVPSFCKSLEKYETIMIFGVSFLRLVYSLVRQELQDKFLSEKDKIPIEKRLILWNHLPK
jgi:hypothetical protein